MSNYYIVPSNKNNNVNIDIQVLDEDDDGTKLMIVNKSLFYYLHRIKQQLDHLQDWDLFKKVSYSYEYVNTKIDTQNKAVCTYEPISRAYFKLYEILYNFKLMNRNTKIKTMHLAEGPGGFIEAMANYRNKYGGKRAKS